MIPRFRLPGVLLAVFCLTLVAETLTIETQAAAPKRPPDEFLDPQRRAIRGGAVAAGSTRG